MAYVMAENISMNDDERKVLYEALIYVREQYTVNAMGEFDPYDGKSFGKETDRMEQLNKIIDLLFPRYILLTEKEKGITFHEGDIVYVLINIKENKLHDYVEHLEGLDPVTIKNEATYIEARLLQKTTVGWNVRIESKTKNIIIKEFWLIYRKNDLN